VAMTPELHPKKMKEMHENQMRLYWISPRLGGWTVDAALAAGARCGAAVTRAMSDTAAFPRTLA